MYDEQRPLSLSVSRQENRPEWGYLETGDTSMNRPEHFPYGISACSWWDCFQPQYFYHQLLSNVAVGVSTRKGQTGKVGYAHLRLSLVLLSNIAMPPPVLTGPLTWIFYLGALSFSLSWSVPILVYRIKHSVERPINGMFNRTLTNQNST